MSFAAKRKKKKKKLTESKTNKYLTLSYKNLTSPLNSLMGRTLVPVMPTSSSDGELASRFSNFFSEKITRIRSEIDAAAVVREFLVDFPLRFTRSLTCSHFRLVTETDVLRYMKETRKTCIH